MLEQAESAVQYATIPFPLMLIAVHAKTCAHHRE